MHKIQSDSNYCKIIPEAEGFCIILKFSFFNNGQLTADYPTCCKLLSKKVAICPFKVKYSRKLEF